MKELTTLDPLTGKPEETNHLSENPDYKAIKDILPFRQAFWRLEKGFLVKSFFKMWIDIFTIVPSIVGSILTVTTGFFLLNQASTSLIIASFGLQQSIYMIFFVTIQFSTMDKMGIELSQNFGRRDFQNMKIKLVQGTISLVLLVLVVSFPIFLFSRTLLMLIHVPEDIATQTQIILRKALFILALQVPSELFKAICMSQGQERIFGLVSYPNLLLNFILCYFLIIKQDLGVSGWLIARFIYELVNFAASLYAFSLTEKETRDTLPLSEALSDFKSYFIESFKFMMGNYTEFLGFDATTYLVTLLNDPDQLSAYTSHLNFISIIYMIGVSSSIVCRTRFNILVGMEERHTAKNYHIFTNFSGLVMGIILGAFFLFVAPLIGQIFASVNPVTNSYFLRFLSFYCLCMPSELTYPVNTMAMKTVGLIDHLLKLNFLMLIGGNIIVGALIFYLGGQGFAFFVCLMTSLYIVNFLYLKACYLDDWSKAQVEGQEALEGLENIEGGNSRRESLRASFHGLSMR